MGAIQVPSSFQVKSFKGSYSVSFIENFSKTLRTESEDGDVVFIDKNVEKLYAQLIKNMNDKVSLIPIDANEENKSYKSLIPLIRDLISFGFKKNNKLIAIGGGVTQDITAFIASIIYRGVDWIFFPTTLLAQGDSCIGSKTSINFEEYKNQLGGFHPPRKIFIDLVFLKTLSKKDLFSGLGEMSHYFVVAGETEFKQYKYDFDKALSSDIVLSKMISNSLKIKKSYIEIDEFDQNKRQVFNYGHSFGHAIESLTNYKIPHGIAVSFGMDMANFISVKRKFLKNSVRLEIRSLLERIWHGYDISNLDCDRFAVALSKDKKNVGRELRLILCKGYGRVFKTSQDLDSQFKRWLEDYFLNELK